MTVGVACLGAAAWFVLRPLVPDAQLFAAPKRALASPMNDVHGPPNEEERSRAFRAPSGEAATLSCESARTIVAQVRKNLAYAPDAVGAQAFALMTTDWLDPYGLWSAAPDAPVGKAIEKDAPAILADLEGRGSPDCAATRGSARALMKWVGELREVFDRARDAGASMTALAAAGDSLFEGATVTRPARELAALLGARTFAFEQALGASGRDYTRAARDRYFPDLDEAAWTRIILASAVRAYVPILDPHGEWAPLDEEASVYDVDLEAKPPARLWDKATRTALGARLDTGAEAPLAAGDVVVSLAGVATAGLSQEQLDQLGLAAAESKSGAQAVLLREGQTQLLTLGLEGPPPEPKGSGGEPASDDTEAERIPFGKGDALVVAIKDVRDDLGDVLTRKILHERARAGRQVTGVVLDLRGNGGGSTDGAYDALGIFIPGAALFPMKRRDGAVEPDRAPTPPNVDRWAGPVATLVDGETASAAEMIAGALSSYRRGPSVGTATFGKGCAQEYLDDDARAGVLRLTTLLYALPDGAAVQRVGLTPNIHVAFTPLPGASPRDREATLAHAPPTWRGPDVRDRAALARAAEGSWTSAWPAHGGDVGPCKDPDVCRALRALGGGAKRTAKGR